MKIKKRSKTLFPTSTLASAPIRATSILNADLFAGGGGASLGIELALGESPHIAINHDRAAIEMHTANHPDTLHYTEDVWSVKPENACRGLPVGLLWGSPDCRHFSSAKGGKPVSKRVRSLAWVIVKWAKLPEWQRPRVIFLENVAEFRTWGRLMRDPRSPNDEVWIPDPKRKGETFRRFCNAFQKLGYTVEYRILNAADYGVPTIRKRLFLIARCDGQAIVWPEPTHAKPDKQGKVPLGRLPWVAVSTCIDWTKPCPSIFDKKLRKSLGLKPVLAPRTMERIAKGVMRYVIQNSKPFLIRIGHYGEQAQGFRGQGADQPLGTVCSINDKSLISPILTKVNNTNCKDDGNRSTSVTKPLHAITGKHGTGVAAAVLARVGNTGGNGDYSNDVGEPLRTVVSKNQDLLVQAFLEKYGDLKAPLISKHYGGVLGHTVDQPLGTVTTVYHHSLTAATLVHFNHGDKQWSGVDEPSRTITASGKHAALVQSLLRKHCLSAQLIKFYGTSETGQPVDRPLDTITAKARFGLVTVVNEQGDDELWQIVDIGMRMLNATELLNAQFSPELAKNYKLTGSQASQVARIGNSVCPLVVKALVAANYQPKVTSEVA